MITYREALMKATSRNKKYDYVREYKNLYLFSIADAEPSFGGFDSPVIVLKETGEYSSITALFASGKGEWMSDDELVYEGDVSDH